MSFEVRINNDEILPKVILEDKISGCFAEIYTLGGLLNQFGICNHTGSYQVVDGFNNMKEAAEEITAGFKSAFLSPFICRLNKGKYVYNNEEYTINKFFLGEHAIHGLIYDNKYDIVQTFADDNSASVQLRTEYRGSDAGYPFSFFINHTWKLTKNNKLTVFSFVQNLNKAAIPYAQGWHPYFKLGTSVDDCTLSFTGNKIVVFDDTLIPTGEIIADNRFENNAPMRGVILDNCFVLDPENSICTLKNNQLLLTILPDETYPYLQVYTPPHRNSIAIENLSGVPDCFNNKIGLLQIAPGDTAEFSTTYQLKLL